MYVNPFQVSLETLIGASALLGHRLEERTRLREAQDRRIVRDVQQHSSTALSHFSQQHLFAVAPLDILVERVENRKQFHILEMNGTGIGGLTNLPGEAVSCVLEDFAKFAESMNESSPLVLIASSGMESAQSPRKNKLIHEKILYAEAMRRGFAGRGHTAQITTLTQLAADPKDVPVLCAPGEIVRLDVPPQIVLGYMKEFLEHLQLDAAGGLMLFGRRVTAVVNDRFCLNLVHHFGPALDLGRLRLMNRSFMAGADKGVAYEMLNQYLEAKPNPITRPLHFARVETREKLIETVVRWVRQGNRTVIKPQGTGLGHGIEFFLSPDESAQDIVARIDGSLKLTEQFYGLPGGALPYTVCEFIDGCTVQRSNHPLHGRKYELRIVVYRDGLMLRPFPSIVKVASEVFDPERPTHQSLINNITASAAATHTAGTEHMLPLSNATTLELLGMSLEDLRQVSALATGYVRFVLDQVQAAPSQLGLPEGVDTVATAKP